jgi:hypothetical protein
VIRAAAGLVERTLDEFRRCGQDRRECVVYWLTDRTSPDLADDLVHPDHMAGPAWYVVEDRWLNSFAIDLADCARAAVAQIHTHPGSFASHSDIDDEFVLVPSPGFVSVVVPDYGRRKDRESWGVHVLERDGTWRLDPGAIEW